MTTPATEKRRNNGETGESRNHRLSLFLRSKRPIPATRAEADSLYAPHARYARATVTRLHRLNELGLLAIRDVQGDPVTQGMAHDAILDALYPDE